MDSGVLGNLQDGIKLIQQVSSQNLSEKKQTITREAVMLHHNGQQQRAIALLEQSSLDMLSDRAYKAAVLSIKAESFHDMRQLEQAKTLYEGAFPFCKR